jgi:hypothetical protein
MPPVYLNPKIPSQLWGEMIRHAAIGYSTAEITKYVSAFLKTKINNNLG